MSDPYFDVYADDVGELRAEVERLRCGIQDYIDGKWAINFKHPNEFFFDLLGEQGKVSVYQRPTGQTRGDLNED